ncbi:MAG: dihydrofolate reductase [Holosporaceae bacterium]|jgi:dihydrofolate reductase|nr:dihydrofolate reductase [Holosporaceae bacterium]
MIKLIALVDSDFGISKNGTIPWSFSEDLKFFYKKTTGSIVVMGRNTFFSLSKGPLKNRINCVISKTLESTDDIEIFYSLEEVPYQDFWIIGGGQLYNYALKNDLVDYALISQVHDNYHADIFINRQRLKKMSQNVLFSNAKYSIIEFYRA